MAAKSDEIRVAVPITEGKNEFRVGAHSSAKTLLGSKYRTTITSNQKELSRNRVGIGLSYRSARLAESIAWNRFLGSLKD